MKCSFILAWFFLVLGIFILIILCLILSNHIVIFSLLGAMLLQLYSESFCCSSAFIILPFILSSVWSSNGVEIKCGPTLAFFLSFLSMLVCTDSLVSTNLQIHLLLFFWFFCTHHLFNHRALGYLVDCICLKYCYLYSSWFFPSNCTYRLAAVHK